MSSAHSIMHFTHINNLPGILASGCLQADNLVDRSSALKVEAADLDIKAVRKSAQVSADDPDRRRRRMAEFLVHHRVPIECFTAIVVRRDTLKEQVEGLLASSGVDIPVFADPSWYF
jgi:hypothetical protein